MAEITEIPLRDLRGMVSDRLINCLLNEGCETLADASRLPRQQLLTTPNFGKKSLRDLEHILAGGDPILVWHPMSLTANKRKLSALELRRSGKTYRQIGVALGVSASRASQIVASGERLELVMRARRATGQPLLVYP